jgi:pyruvate dehydrogenase (quinone)
VTWFARHVQMRSGMMASVSGSLASMGCGVPYAIAAKFAHPDRPVIAMVGDGAMQMNGINELITIAKYWQQWQDPRLIILVLNNGDLNFVTWEQRQVGMPKNEVTQPMPNFPYAQYAQLLGLKGIEVTHPNDVGSAWDEALSANQPVVLEAHTDPNVPSVLPPQVPRKFLQEYFVALSKGDSEAMGVVKQLFQEIADLRAPAASKA